MSNAIKIAQMRGLEVVEYGVGEFPLIIAPIDSFKAYLFDLKTSGFKLLSDLTCVDYLNFIEEKPARFAVVYNLFNLDSVERIFVKVFLNENQSIDSVSDIFLTANWHEREVFDMFGIEFEGHPNLVKILTPEDLDGHPLRKDFALGETPTLFREGRYLDPTAFRAGLTGQDKGLTGWRGGTRRGRK